MSHLLLLCAHLAALRAFVWACGLWQRLRDELTVIPGRLSMAYGLLRLSRFRPHSWLGSIRIAFGSAVEIQRFMWRLNRIQVGARTDMAIGKSELHITRIA